ncbi:MAG: DUF4389 domain-containing protein [Bacteroidota bacterium]|nr:DUF4389 domain-containing protein [Bacteroidota bacterium]
MLTFEIQHQPAYSRGELLVRTFFGWLYICIPHLILIFFFAFAVWFMTLATFFIILFTGVTPGWYHEWAVKLNRWALRLSARVYNLVDGYPAFGMEGTDDKTSYDLEFWQISRGEMLLRTFLGWIYVGIPHGFILYFRFIGSLFLMIFAFFAVLFTGNYPEEWHRFNTGTLRWQNRVNLYLVWLYKDYPPFSGKPDSKQAFEFEAAQS